MKEIAKKQEPKLPKDSQYYHPTSEGPCGQTVLNYLQSERKIPKEVIEELRIGEDRQRFVKLNREATCVVFNYYLGGKLVNQKFRSIEGKDFLQTPNCKSVPYNIDSICSSLDDNGEREPVYIVEGEMDVAAMIAAGFNRCISIPNGACSKLDWIDELWETHFKGVRKYIIAVDTDKAGEQLAEKLVERLGSARCCRMTFGEDCKDANECLIKFGAETLQSFESVKTPYPLKDITFPSERKASMDRYYERGVEKGHKTGWVGQEGPEATFRSLDDIIQWDTRQLCLVTGRTNDGKSEFINELVIRLILESGWKAAWFTPEELPVEHHMSKLCEKLTGKEFPKEGSEPSDKTMSRDDYEESYSWICENVTYYTPKSYETTIGDLLVNMDNIIMCRGVKIIVIDPYNYIDKELNNEFEINRRDSEIISKIRNFAIERNVLIFLVAHPRKQSPDYGGRRRVEMYDISGTADLVNKADICVVVDRNPKNDQTTIYIDKVRNKNYGGRGKCHFIYNVINGRFTPWKEIKGDPNDHSIGHENNSATYAAEKKGLKHDMTNWLNPTMPVTPLSHDSMPERVIEDVKQDLPF